MSWEDLTDEQLLALPTHRLLIVFRQIYNEMELKRNLIKGVLNNRPHVERKEQPEPTLLRSGKIGPKARARRERRNRWRFPLWRLPEDEPSPPVGPITDPESAIGQQVFKRSNKPFKSKDVYNTVKAVTVNPHTKLTAFTFEEDDSIVDAHICDIRKKK